MIDSRGFVLENRPFGPLLGRSSGKCFSLYSGLIIPGGQIWGSNLGSILGRKVLKVASVATFLASEPVLGGPARPLGGVGKVPPNRNFGAKFGGVIRVRTWPDRSGGALARSRRSPGEVPEEPWRGPGGPPGWTPGSWGATWLEAPDFALGA